MATAPARGDGTSGTWAVTGRAQLVLQKCSDGVFFLDRDWRFVYLNAAAERLFDRGPGELLGRGVWDEFPSAVGSRSQIEYERAMRTQTPVTFDDDYAPLDTMFEVRAFPDHDGLAVFFRDVDDDRRLRQQEEAHVRLTRAILDSLPAHTAVLGADGTIISTNGPWDAFGLAEGAVPGLSTAGANYVEVCRRSAGDGDPDAAAVLEGLGEVAAGTRDSFQLDYECSAPEVERWFSLHALPLVGHDGVIVSHTDITSQVLSQRQLLHQAQHDDLTGLPNRSRLLELLEEAMADHEASPDVAVLLIDLDGFKNVNDSLGHDVGDALLQEVAERFSRTIRLGDVVARLGGDEFVVVAHDCDAEAATQLADRIHRTLADSFDVAGIHLPMTASIGIALGLDEDTRPADLLRGGDVAMYAAKEAGRDRSHVFSSELGTAAHDRLALATGLRLAGRRGELVLHYQPIVTLPGREVLEVEALMRWNHPERGLLFPGAFIELAEQTGLIVPITRWLLSEALSQVASWSRAGIEVSVAVNVAAQHLSLGTLLEDVSEALVVAGVRPQQLVVELTESDIAHDVRGAAAQLAALRAMGVRIAMDDFGSGYSSLGQLATLPVDVIKIDGSLVKDLGTQAAGPAGTIISAVTSIASMLGMDTVAEGIETAEQLAAVVGLGCTRGQGFLLGRPVPEPELRASLERGRPPTAVPTDAG